MKSYNSINILSLTLLFFISCFNTVLAGEKSKLVGADYEKLCSIYKVVISKPHDLSAKEMLLTEKVQKELPELFNSLFIHIIKANSNIRYKLIKGFSKQQNNIVWECESARKYYDNNFR